MLRPLIILVFGAILLTNCSDSPTQIVRDNPDDPESFGFVLNPVQDISTSTLEDKMIEIVWTDSSLVPTNYILRKKLRTSDNYIALDTLDKDTREFIDKSGEITKDTKYEIISLRKQESGEEVFSEGINSGIDFGDFKFASALYNSDTTAIKFSWMFNSKWPFTGVALSQNPELVVLDTLTNKNVYTTPTFDGNRGEFFEIRFFVNEKNFDLQNPYQRIIGEYHPDNFIIE